MNKFKIAIFTISIIIFSLIGIKKLIYINQVKDLKNKEESFLNESIRVLNECFDLENKNKRTLNESIKLIEYCLEEYGYKNWFQNFNDELFNTLLTYKLINYFWSISLVSSMIFCY